MNNLPNIAIGLVTYRRTAEALRTVKSTIENLNYPKDKRAWYVGDDGSDVKHLASILSMLEMNDEKIIGYHSERFRNPGQEDTHNAGIGWNRVLGLCHQYSDFVLFLEDDWELDEPLDLVLSVELLTEREDVGLVSYRILSVGADVHTVGYKGDIYLKYHRSTQYAYSGNPSLRHARFTRAYGTFAEDRNPGLIELHMDDQYRLRSGPDIWRPLAISPWGAWKHVGQDKTWR